VLFSSCRTGRLEWYSSVCQSVSQLHCVRRYYPTSKPLRMYATTTTDTNTKAPYIICLSRILCHIWYADTYESHICRSDSFTRNGNCRLQFAVTSDAALNKCTEKKQLKSNICTFYGQKPQSPVFKARPRQLGVAPPDPRNKKERTIESSAQVRWLGSSSLGPPRQIPRGFAAST
jgi:hypothetical protein